jgi:hypothetical protein
MTILFVGWRAWLNEVAVSSCELKQEQKQKPEQKQVLRLRRRMTTKKQMPEQKQKQKQALRHATPASKTARRRPWFGEG